MTGSQKALHAVIRRTQDGMHGRGNAHVRYQQREILEPQCLGLQQAGRVGRRGGFKPDREEDHLLIGVLPGNFHGIQRRINHANLSAGGLNGKQILI